MTKLIAAHHYTLTGKDVYQALRLNKQWILKDVNKSFDNVILGFIVLNDNILSPVEIVSKDKKWGKPEEIDGAEYTVNMLRACKVKVDKIELNYKSEKRK